MSSKKFRFGRALEARDDGPSDTAEARVPEVIVEIPAGRDEASVVAGCVVARQFDLGVVPCKNRTVLELGSSASLGLPSVVAALNGARCVVATDFRSDHAARAGIGRTAASCALVPTSDDAAPTFHVEELRWGVKDHVQSALEKVNGVGFEFVILSDIDGVDLHDVLRTTSTCMLKDTRSAAFVVLAPDAVPHFRSCAEEYGMRTELLATGEENGVKATVYKMTFVIDDAGAPTDTDSVDVIVEGTGFAESAVAAACARAGLKVMHFDQFEGYGGTTSTLPLREFLPFVTAHCGGEVHCHDEGAECVTSRDLLVDVSPMCFTARGGIIDALVDAGAGKQLEFNNVDRILVAQKAAPSPSAPAGDDSTPTDAPSATLVRAPFSRADLFKHPSLSPLDLRKVVKVLQDLQKDTVVVPEVEGATLNMVLRDYKLNDATASLITANGLIANPAAGAKEGIAALQRAMASVGRFGGVTPFLLSTYGSCEVPQSLCRLCAVYEGVYVLRRAVTDVVTDATNNTVTHVRVSNNQKIACKHFVTGAARVHTATGDGDGGCLVFRSVVVSEAPLVSWTTLEQEHRDAAEDDEAEVSRSSGHAPIAILTLEGDAWRGVRVLQMNHHTNTTAKGSYLLHFTAPATPSGGMTRQQFDSVVSDVLASFCIQDSVKFSCSFTLPPASKYTVDVSGAPQNVHVLPGYEQDVTDAPAYDHALRVFRAIHATTVANRAGQPASTATGDDVIVPDADEAGPPPLLAPLPDPYAGNAELMVDEETELIARAVQQPATAQTVAAPAPDAVDTSAAHPTDAVEAAGEALADANPIVPTTAQVEDK